MTATSLPHVLPRALTVSQAAEYWGLSSNTFRKLARTGISYQPELIVPACFVSLILTVRSPLTVTIL